MALSIGPCKTSMHYGWQAMGQAVAKADARWTGQLCTCTIGLLCSMHARGTHCFECDITYQNAQTAAGHVSHHEKWRIVCPPALPPEFLSLSFGLCGQAAGRPWVPSLRYTRCLRCIALMQLLQQGLVLKQERLQVCALLVCCLMSVLADFVQLQCPREVQQTVGKCAAPPLSEEVPLRSKILVFSGTHT